MNQYVGQQYGSGAPVPEPELQGATPRTVRFTGKTRGWRYFLLNLAVVIMIFAQWRVAVNIRELTELAAGGRLTMATITDKQEYHGKSTTYKLFYSFTPVGGMGTVDDSIEVNSSDYYAINTGSEVPATYMPSRPEEHRYGRVDEERVMTARQVGTIGLLIGGFAALATLGGMEWYFRSRLSLLKDGEATVGEVTDHKIIRGKSTTYKLVYRYWLPDGELVYKDVAVAKSVFDRFGNNEPITILYNPNSPKTGIPYVILTEAEVYTPV